ncbi:MAG: HlyC/CorC family transporter [Clostridia bacterium]|nr:HlyC/CorC family transporter [Clostridia bacterium]
MDIVKQLLLQLILILLNAFFAATEIAVISLNEKKVRAQAEDGDKKAAKILKIIEEPTRFLSAIQVGITLAGFLGSAFAADNFAERLSAFVIKSFEIAPKYYGLINTVSVVLITLVLSYFTLVLGELVPKRVAMRHKEKLANAVCGFIGGLTTVLKPVIWLLTVSTNGMLRLFGIDPHAKDEAVSEEDIVIMLDAGADEGTLNEDDIEYIKNVFKLDRLCAADVMTQRSSMVVIEEGADEAQILETLANEGYSRIPVFDGEGEKVVGILHAREYLLHKADADFTLDSVLLAPVFVPETAHLDALFKDMQNDHRHMVIVVNEYGQVSGIVTMEDILEQIVGEIWDEQDEATEEIVAVGEDTYRVLSSISLEAFFAFFGTEVEEGILSTTVNGWLTEQCGCIPQIGTTITHENLTITVTNADDVMTHELTVKKAEPVTEAEADSEE